MKKAEKTKKKGLKLTSLELSLSGFIVASILTSITGSGWLSLGITMVMLVLYFKYIAAD